MAKSFEEIQAHATALKEGYSPRDTVFEEYEAMYRVEDDSLPSSDDIKKAISPDARNTLLGAVRLISATDPVWSVPQEINQQAEVEDRDKIETICDAIFKAIGRVKKKPAHYSPILSGLLYGEVHIAVQLVDDLLKMAKSPAEKRRLEEVRRKTPILFETLNPKLGYPEFDSLGLVAYYTQRTMTIGDLLSRFPSADVGEKKRTDTTTYNEYWDFEKHCVWVEGINDPLLDEEHKLPYIPIAAMITEGSEFEEDIEETRQPFLYTAKKSQMWKMHNLALTLMSSNVFALASNATFIYEKNDPNKKNPDQDYTIRGGVFSINTNEKFYPLAKNAIDASMLSIAQIYEQKVTESTMYRQALGEPLSGNAPFSMVAMLSQAGRLPLVPYQRMLSWALADAMYIGLQNLRTSGAQNVQVMGENGVIELNVSDIPESFDLRTSLEIAMPQDKREQAAIATALTQGDHPLASYEYVRENHLGIGQSSEMDKQIWKEKAAYVQAALKLQAMQEQAMMQAQQAQQAQQQPAQGQPQQEDIWAMQQQALEQQAMQQAGAMPPEAMQPGMTPQAEQGLPGLPARSPIMNQGGNPEGGPINAA